MSSEQVLSVKNIDVWKKVLLPAILYLQANESYSFDQMLVQIKRVSLSILGNNLTDILISEVVPRALIVYGTRNNKLGLRLIDIIQAVRDAKSGDEAERSMRSAIGDDEILFVSQREKFFYELVQSINLELIEITKHYKPRRNARIVALLIGGSFGSMEFTSTSDFDITYIYKDGLDRELSLDNQRKIIEYAIQFVFQKWKKKMSFDHDYGFIDINDIENFAFNGTKCALITPNQGYVFRISRKIKELNIFS